MRKLIALLLALSGAYAMSARAVDAPAGTVIVNTAEVHYLVSGIPFNQSASANVTVAQLVNVTVSWQNSSDVSVTAGAASQTLLFKVTNTGNGTDTFKLADTLVTPGGTTFTPASCLVYFDTANTGVFDPSDVLYTPGTNDPQLVQDASKNMLIVCNVPPGAADTALGEMQLGATSKTATGVFGTVNAGAGVGGVDAIVGSTTGISDATGIYQVHQFAVAYVKSATVSAPGGGHKVVSGATIEYTLTVTPSGTASGTNLVVTDPVPADTTFVTGSLLLNGTAVAPLNGDYNVTTPGAVTVKLGTLAGSATAQIVKFQVTIN
jgi:uncharacterized repeat protein (TIGR01451 family)